MTTSISESISHAAARSLRNGALPHVPPPATPVATRVQLSLSVPPERSAPARGTPEIVFASPLREDPWRVAMQPGGQPGLWTAEILTPQEPTLLFYHFELPDGTLIRERRQVEGLEKEMFRDPPRATGPERWYSRERQPEILYEKPVYGKWKELDFRIAVYLPEGMPPDWVRGQVFYQIFPDRFARSGETPHRERTYDREALHQPWGAPPEHPPESRDFYGGNLRGVIEKLDYLADLGVTTVYFTPIFESPTNHRYDAIDYFKIDPQLGTEQDFRELLAAAKARGMRVMLDGVFNHCSSESVYFRAAQTDQLSPYYRWFHFNHWPEDYLGWVGVKTMPEFVECPEVEQFFFGEQGVAQHWLGFGTAGWRTDVTPWLSDDYWRRFRRAVRRAFPEAYLVAEDWADASRRLLGDMFDATMNYRFSYAAVGWAGGKINALELDDRLETLRRDTPPGVFHAQLNLLDSHDTARALSLLGGDRKRQMLAAALQMAYPGAPMIYSGDETAQLGEYAENSRRAFPWGALDEEVHACYRRLIHARRGSRALWDGDVQTVWIDPRGGYGFLRRCGGEMVLAVFNNSVVPLEGEIALGRILDGTWYDLLQSSPDAQCMDGVIRVTVPPFGTAWYAPTSA